MRNIYCLLLLLHPEPFLCNPQGSMSTTTIMLGTQVGVSDPKEEAIEETPQMENEEQIADDMNNAIEQNGECVIK